MLDSGKTAEEVCRECPELLPEVRQRWQEFCLIDAQVRTLLPGLVAPPAADTVAAVPPPAPQPPRRLEDAARRRLRRAVRPGTVPARGGSGRRPAAREHRAGVRRG